MAILMTTLKVVGASILALAGSGATYQYVSTKLDEQNFPPIGRMVDIGGYKLHMIDKGQNNSGPVVVMEAGAGCNSLDWQLVQPEIAKFARVITYDRAGYAWSDASSLPRTAENMVEELHTMLHNANIPAPYILVAHSFGGINARLFVSKYPHEVAGEVLIDANSEDGYEKLQIKDSEFTSLLIMRINYALCYLGISRLLGNLSSVQAIIEKMTEKYPAEIKKNYLSQKSTSKCLNASMQEVLKLEQSCNQLKAAGGLLGDKPLTVISACKPMTIEEANGLISQERLDVFNKIIPELQADLVTKSSRGKLIRAENSGHQVPYDQPEIIINAVRQMYEELTK